MMRNRKIVGLCALAAASLALASCKSKSQCEDLEDRIADLEDQNQYLRDQLEQADAAKSGAGSKAGAARASPILVPPVQRAPDEPRQHAVPDDRPVLDDDDAATRAARNAADAAQDAEAADTPN